jgi:leader peptidase (prepilin peptidase) / N-methyltransferase
MTAWGVVAVCGVGGGAAGPLLDYVARQVRRPVAPLVSSSVASDGAAGAGSLAALEGPAPTESRVPAESRAAARPPVTVTEEPRSRGAVVLEEGAVAVVTAFVCALAAVRLGAVPQLAAYCVLAGALVVVSVTDLRTGLVPRRVVYAAAVLAGAALLAASATNGAWRPMLDALGGGVVAFFLFGAVWWISPKAMGFGDVRLAGLCGGALGWLGWAPLYLGFLAAFVAGSLFGLAVLFVSGRHRLPFAPALALGTMFGVLWGIWLGGLWLHVR